VLLALVVQRAPSKIVTGVRPALAGGLALLLAAICLTLTGAPARVLSNNAVALSGEVGALHGPRTVCQPEGALPAGISAVRLTLESVIGPQVSLAASSQGRIVLSGARGSGWTGADVTVPVDPGDAGGPGTTLCVTVGQGREPVLMLGSGSGPALAATGDGTALGGRVRVEYLGAGRRSWWSLALPVARRLGLGRAPSGTWVAGLILALMAAVAALASWLLVRELDTDRVIPLRPSAIADARSKRRLAACVRAFRRVPQAAWLCALIACLNAAAWSLLSPPFQVPDEPAHFAYVQQLVEAGQLPYRPSGEAGPYSAEEQTALEDLRHNAVQFMPSEGTISSLAQQRRLEGDLAQPLPRRGSGFAGTATNEPPLYYTLEAIPYALGSSGSLLDRLELMRLFSCLFAGVSALFAFMFVRESLPGTPWAWTVGGLTIALAPLVASISGGVNPEGMLCAVSMALFYLLARAFRRGLTRTLAATICAVLVAGVLTKLNALGLVPGTILGLLVTARRASLGARRTIYRAAGATLILAACALLVAIVLRPLTGSQSADFLGSAVARVTHTGNVLGELSYAWQFYLPRLPGMRSYFPGLFTPRQLWFDGLVGLYGWADTLFPAWVYDVALVPAGLIGLLGMRALLSARLALRRRASELAVYATMAVGVLALVGIASYTSDVLGNGGPLWEPRYLLPTFALAAAAFALAARGAGRRLGPVVGVAIVVLVLGHDVFSQLLVVSRYYG
jgi:hypothetical protein